MVILPIIGQFPGFSCESELGFDSVSLLHLACLLLMWAYVHTETHLFVWAKY